LLLQASPRPRTRACSTRNPNKKPEDAAAGAERAGMQDVSIWVDVSWGFRNQGAANNLNRSHQVFAARGYRVLSVQPYVENGDLQGFFVTYRKP
jgi:hypothetical protein